MERCFSDTGITRNVLKNILVFTVSGNDVSTIWAEDIYKGIMTSAQGCQKPICPQTSIYRINFIRKINLTNYWYSWVQLFNLIAQKENWWHCYAWRNYISFSIRWQYVNRVGSLYSYNLSYKYIVGISDLSIKHCLGKCHNCVEKTIQSLI